jgi:branched-chain amino acid transport system substrate-binding protein
MFKKIYGLLILLLVASMLLVACGGNDQNANTDNDTNTNTDVEPPDENTGNDEPADEPADEPVVDTGPPDLTGETITIYHFGDISGPYASVTGPLVNGAIDYVAYLNETGGIFGATIELQFADTGGSVDEAVAAYDRFTTEDDNVLMFIMYGSPESEALYERLYEDKIPALSAGLSSLAFYGIPDGYMFGLGPIYPDQFGYFLDYATVHWDEMKPEGAGDEINVALLSWPGAFGQGALTDESRAYAESLGVSIVWEETYDLSPTADTTTAILNAEAAGANVIYTNTLAFGPALLLNDLNNLGIRDKFVVAGCNWSMDVGTFAFLADPAYGYGFYAPFPFAWWSETDNPSIQLAHELFTTYERTPGEQNVGRLLIMGGIDMGKYVIEQAILEGGFENLTGEAIFNQLIQLSGYEIMGGLATADFTNGRRAPGLIQIRQIQGGPDAFVILQDFSPAPDLRPTP